MMVVREASFRGVHLMVGIVVLGLASSLGISACGGEEGSRCGDGYLDKGEECDHGVANSDAPDAVCRTNCMVKRCGDGIVDPAAGEECDHGPGNSDGPDAVCNTGCKLRGCGDGLLDLEAGEECDHGTANSDAPDAVCRTDCTLRRCGDGVVDTGEECDLGAGNSDEPNGACRTDCTPRRCGDGIVDSGEQCDNGAANSNAPNAACRPDCRPRRCGDGIRDSGEACDDGNTISGDGCSGDCQQVEVCGDGVVSVGEQCDDGNSVNWDGCHQCQVVERRANSSTSGDQSYPRVAMAQDDSFVVVWRSMGQDGSEGGIYMQRYGSSGLPVGSETRVNVTTAGHQSAPDVAMAPDGRFVVAWQSPGQDGSGIGVIMRRYDAAGVAEGGEEIVNTTTQYDQVTPAVAMADDGSFVVLFVDGSGLWEAGLGIRGQRFDSDGIFAGDEFGVNTYTSSHQTDPAVAMAGDGRFVAVWTSAGQDGSGEGVFGQRFSAAGVAQGDEFQVNSTTSSDQQRAGVALAEDGSFVVVWETRNYYSYVFQAYLQQFGSDGEPVGTETLVDSTTNQYRMEPTVAVDQGGSFVVAWINQALPATDADIYLRRFSSAGSPMGVTSRANVYVAENQYYPHVARAANGRFVLAWASDQQDGNGWGVYLQRYTASGVALGSNP